ncbi:hypothetical protein [Fulvivirga ligni]|uniref:hypothetical protein n=1 Tax=Fulvivirga ligni TaxID=2904246 RepID=UPI001F1E5729|nr:hypothetical protein [Fulvivirga ligni]UII21594.1 hypothetical protein LVD16_27580 [Fulvivirga ligni]
MPNLNCEYALPKGHFFNCDHGIEYNQIQFHQPKFDISNLWIHFGFREQEKFFKISNQDGLTLSLLRLLPLSILNNNYYGISKIGTLPSYRGNGYAYQLYRCAIERLDLPIICDASLTIPGSYNIWMKLIHESKTDSFEIKHLDTKSEAIKDYAYKNPMPRIWGYDEDILEIIKDDKENLEDAYLDGEVSEELYKFLKHHLNLLEDRSHVRLSANKK